MVAPRFLRCLLCASEAHEGNQDVKVHNNATVELKAETCPNTAEAFLSSLRGPILAIQGGWLSRAKRLIEVLEGTANITATLYGIERGDVTGTLNFCALAGGSPAHHDEPVLLDVDQVAVLNRACSRLVPVTATTDRAAACIPLLHGSAAYGALWLMPNPGVIHRPASSTAALLATSGSLSRCATATTAAATAPTTAACAAALLSSSTALDSLAFIVSVVLLGPDGAEQMGWLSTIVQRLLAAASLHALITDLCDALSSYVARRFSLDAVVRAALAPGASTGGVASGAGGEGPTCAVAYLFGAVQAPPLRASLSGRNLAAAAIGTGSHCCSGGPAAGTRGSLDGAGVGVQGVAVAVGQLLGTSVGAGAAAGTAAAPGAHQQQQQQQQQSHSVRLRAGGSRRPSLLMGSGTGGGGGTASPHPARPMDALGSSVGVAGGVGGTGVGTIRTSRLLAGVMGSTSGASPGGQGQGAAACAAHACGPSPPPLGPQGSISVTARPRSLIGLDVGPPVVPAGLATTGLLLDSRRTMSGSTARSIVIPLQPAAGERFDGSVGAAGPQVLPLLALQPLAPAAVPTVHAHSFPLQQTLLAQAYAAAVSDQPVASGLPGRGRGSGAARAPGAPAAPWSSAAVVEDCCSLVQDVHRPCRDVCLLMSLFSQQQQQQAVSQQQQQQPTGRGPGGGSCPPSVGSSPPPGTNGGLMRFVAGAAGGRTAQPNLGGTRGAGATTLRSLALLLLPLGTSTEDSADGGGGSHVPLAPGGRHSAGAGTTAAAGGSSQGAARPGGGCRGGGGGGGYLGLYVCFGSRLPRPLLEVLHAGCQELLDLMLREVVSGRMLGSLAPECEAFRGALRGAFAVLRGQEVPAEDSSGIPGGGPPGVGMPAGVGTGTPASAIMGSGGSFTAIGGTRRSNSLIPYSNGGAGCRAVPMFGRNSHMVLCGSSEPALGGGGGGPVGASPASPAGGGGGGSLVLPFGVTRLSNRPLSGILSGAVWTANELVEEAQPAAGSPWPAEGRSASPGPGQGPGQGGTGKLPFTALVKSVLNLANRSTGGAGSPFTTNAAFGTAGVNATTADASTTNATARTVTGAIAPVATAANPAAACGVGGSCCCVLDPPYQVASAGTAAVDDLLSSLLTTLPPQQQHGADSHLLSTQQHRQQTGTSSLGMGTGGACGAGGGISSSTLQGPLPSSAYMQWQCDSIIRVTGLDPSDLARQQMDLLVTSIQATTAEAAAAAAAAGPERSYFQADLAHLQLREVLGRGGGGVVLRGKIGTTDVAVKLMEMPISSDKNGKPGAGGEGEGEEEEQDGCSPAEDSARRLRARRVMLRHAMELWCGSALSHPNIVQVYTSYNSVVLKYRKTPNGSREFYLVPAPASVPPPSPLVTPTPGLSGAAVIPEGPAAGAGAAAAAGGEGAGGGRDCHIAEPSDSTCTALLVEWCDRGSLATVLQSRAFPRMVQRPPDDDGRGLLYDMKDVYLTLLDVALALRHLHAQGLVHRDVKPANLLLKSNPRDYRGFTVKLADFGFVVQMTEVDAEGVRYAVVDQSCGTVTHMAPEALSKQSRLDASADVFSFGILMWEMLAGGMRPYSQVPLDRLARLVTRGGRPAFPECVPQAYRRLAAACWSAAPSKRPRASDLVAAVTAELAAITA